MQLKEIESQLVQKDEVIARLKEDCKYLFLTSTPFKTQLIGDQMDTTENKDTTEKMDTTENKDTTEKMDTTGKVETLQEQPGFIPLQKKVHFKNYAQEENAVLKSSIQLLEYQNQHKQMESDFLRQENAKFKSSKLIQILNIFSDLDTASC